MPCPSPCFSFSRTVLYDTIAYYLIGTYCKISNSAKTFRESVACRLRTVEGGGDVLYT